MLGFALWMVMNEKSLLAQKSDNEVSDLGRNCLLTVGLLVPQSGGWFGGLGGSVHSVLTEHHTKFPSFREQGCFGQSPLPGHPATQMPGSRKNCPKCPWPLNMGAVLSTQVECSDMAQTGTTFPAHSGCECEHQYLTQSFKIYSKGSFFKGY